MSPSAEKLCGTLGNENREAATRKSDSKTETAEKEVKLGGKEQLEWSQRQQEK